MACCGMIWTPYDWLNKGYSFCMATVVIIGGGRGFKISVRHSNQPNRSKLLLYSRYFTLTFPLNSCAQAARQSTSVVKVGVVYVGVHVLRCLKEGWLRLQINGFVLLVIY